mgnify:CR=1 FL=1
MNKEPMYLKEFSETFYDPAKTDPTAHVISYNVLVDTGDYTRRVTWNNKRDYLEIVDTAKRGKCIAQAQGTKDEQA